MPEALEHIRVIDLTTAWAGPFATMILADLGAQVIRVEAIQRIDSWRLLNQMRPSEDGAWERSMSGNSVNRNKYGITLDLTNPRGVRVFKSLVKVADIVIENYSPRVMLNFGLDYPVLKAINPSLIMLSLPGWGMTGPWRYYVGFARTVEQLGGLSQLTGYLDSGPAVIGPGLDIGDPVAGLSGAFALLISLQHRLTTGQGQYIDCSQNEALTCLIGDAVMDYTMNKRVQGRRGNRHPFMAPHGCYRCRDLNNDDRRVAIAIGSDEEWVHFSDAMGNPAWTKEQRFADSLSRWQNQD